MKVDRLTALFRGLNETTREVKSTQKLPQDTVAENTEAVRIASDFGESEASASERRTRVEELKRQVAEGRYKPDTREVAVAVVKELLY